MLVAAAVAALFVVRPVPPSGVILRWWRDGSLALITAFAVAVGFYSSLGTNVSGLHDALGTYAELARRLGTGNTGHEKPWWYFVRLFTWHREGGLVFEQAGFSALAVVGVGVAWAGKNPTLRWAAAYSVAILLVLSATAYKTPWHAIQLVPGLALLAAGAVAALSRIRQGTVLAAVGAAAVFGLLIFQTDRVTRTYASDARNPYAYVHSSPDVLKFRSLVRAAQSRLPSQPVRVISEEYWPLPWYLRGLDTIGYWTQIPADCDGALVIASAGLADAVHARLHGDYDQSYLGLRPGFVCVVFTPRP